MKLASVILAGLLAMAALPAAEEGYEAEGRAGFGAFVTPPTLEEQAERDIVPGDGAIVRFVRPGSTAESLGLQPGDVIRSINDVAVQSHRDVRGVVRTVAPGDEATVVVTGSNGVTRTLDGAFKERQPRRGPPPWGNGPPPWAMNGVPPPWMQTPDEVIGEQRQQLLGEKQRLDAIATDLAATRAALAAGDGAWICTIAVHQE